MRKSEVSIPAKEIALLVWDGYQKGDIKKYNIAALLEWCSLQRSNIKMYFVDKETGKVKDAIFQTFIKQLLENQMDVTRKLF